MIKCYKCGAELPDDTKFCNKCGASFEPVLKYYCPYCDNEIVSKDAKFCNKCGKSFNDENKLIEDYDDHAKYVCNKCGVLLKSKRAKFCKNCGNAFDDKNKPLKWDYNNPLYRLCLNCGEPHELTGYPVKCAKCGHDLDLKPRKSPEPTTEDNKIIEENKAKERLKKIEEEKAKAKAEAEAREAEEKLRLEREEKRKKIKKITIKVLISIAALIVLLIAAAFIWHSFDDKNISKAETLMAEGDYNGAIKYYGYIMPLSKAKNECNSKVEKIKAAALKYESAAASYEKNEYLKAAQLSKEAVKEYNDFKLADDLFNKSMESLGTYLKQIYDEKKYKEVYDTVNVIYKPYRTEQINNVYDSVTGMILENCRTAQKYYDACNMDEAIKYANAARAIKPEDEWAESIVTQAKQYNNYAADLSNGAAAYNRGDWSTARDYYDMVPNNDVGNKAEANYSTFVSKIKEDILYYYDPVEISNKDEYGVYSFTGNHDFADYTLYFTLSNKTNRTVEVRVKFKCNDSTEYGTYYLSPKETSSFAYTMDNVFVYSDGTYSITIDGTSYN